MPGMMDVWNGTDAWEQLSTECQTASPCTASVRTSVGLICDVEVTILDPHRGVAVIILCDHTQRPYTVE